MPFPRNLSQESRGCMASSDRSFECGHCKCLDDSLGWLGFHDNFLAEHHLLGCLCGWLSARLDPGESGDSEDACLLHFCLTKLCQRVQDCLRESLQWSPWSWPCLLLPFSLLRPLPWWCFPQRSVRESLQWSPWSWPCLLLSP